MSYRGGVFCKGGTSKDEHKADIEEECDETCEVPNTVEQEISRGSQLFDIEDAQEIENPNDQDDDEQVMKELERQISSRRLREGSPRLQIKPTFGPTNAEGVLILHIGEVRRCVALNLISADKLTDGDESEKEQDERHQVLPVESIDHVVDPNVVEEQFLNRGDDGHGRG